MGAAEKLVEAMSGKYDQPAFRLYDLVAALNDVDALLDESEGELTPEIEAKLEALTDTFEQKVDNICRLRQGRMASAEMCDVEIKRLQARKKAHEKSADSLRLFLYGAMKRLAKDKIKTPLYTVWVQQNPPSIKWTRETEELPDEFRRVKVEPDIAKAQEKLKAHEWLPDGFQITTGESVRIR